MRGSELHVPSLWVWEILNVVAVTVRRGRITADRGKDFLTQLGTLKFRIDSSPAVTDFPRLRALAERNGLTAYDVAYLDLAIRLSLPLATQDDDLSKAAIAHGIEVLGQSPQTVP
jgi:predicted nucleic acid-binding protein